MIDVDAALVITEAGFPRGPERLVDKLGLTVHHTRMSGCDGWCVRRGDRAILRINSDTPKTRQRFTLAHEIAHLLLDIEPDVLVSGHEPLAENRAEERKVNRLTGELLLPLSHLQQLITPPLVNPTTLRQVARRAAVSELMAACRIARLCEQLGLNNAAVLGFSGERLAWKWSTTLKVPDSLAVALLAGARGSRPGVFRHTQEGGDVVTASVVGSPGYPAVFAQLVPAEVAKGKSRGEQLAELADELFGADPSFRGSVNGCISAFKSRHAGSMSLAEALAAFCGAYSDRWTGAAAKRIWAARGRRYLSLRLSEWFD